MSEQYVDLRSDTVTLPTDEMREAMQRAEVGDYMRGEDPTMNRLEALAAEKVAKEAAIFVPSGTMGNLVCLMTHTHRGDEVLLDAEAHAYYYELGSFAALGGLSPRLIHGTYGVMEPADIEAAIRPASPFFPVPRLLCLENTHNRAGGSAVRSEDMAGMSKVAREHGLAVHLDGARVFNAAIALGVEAGELTKHADSVMFCLSKGLSAPVGSIVAGTHDFIERAKRVRKSLGGDMRQCGVLAAAGIVALERMVDRLAEDHSTAALLTEGLREIPGLVLDEPPIATNMVFLDTAGLGIDAAQFVARLKEHGVLGIVYARTRVRLVTHRHIGSSEVDKATQAVKEVVANLG